MVAIVDLSLTLSLEWRVWLVLIDMFTIQAVRSHATGLNPTQGSSVFSYLKFTGCFGCMRLSCIILRASLMKVMRT